MRMNLKLFRVKQNMTQEQMAKKVGITRANYAAIEKGTRNGRKFFWQSLQKAFNIPDEEMWKLQKQDD